MIELEDLLDTLYPPEHESDVDYSGLTVMVTGAGGSIGSKLCQRLFNCGVRRFILVELSEFSLYQVNLGLVNAGAATKPVLGSYGDFGLLRSVMVIDPPDRVYHVGAYKHVPMIEENPLSGIRNNFLNAVTLIRLCEVLKVPHFLLVSTDKAVNPSSVMGASKILVENALLNSAIPNHKVVRFGNVLGSSGSVVPLFYDQIRKGRDVTITDERMTRYFMSIRQAVSLIVDCDVLEGRRFLLSMGEPILILDIAKKIAVAMDMPLSTKIIGVRMGEKLHEELTTTKVESTENKVIFKVDEKILSRHELDRAINRIMFMTMNEEVLPFLKSLSLGYKPSHFDRSVLVGKMNAESLIDDCFKNPDPLDYKD